MSKAKRQTLKADKRYTLDLRRSDIMKGTIEEGSSCPLALAVGRTFGSENVFVDPTEIVVRTDDAGKFVVPTPVKLQRFIKRFDSISEAAWDSDREDYDKKKERRLRKALKPFRFSLKFDFVEAQSY